MQEPQLVGYGVDTLILSMRYTDEKYQPIKKELSEEIAYELDELQGAARRKNGNDLTVVIPGRLALCRTAWRRQTMAVAAHLALAEPGGVAWDVQRYHRTSALFLGIPLVAGMVR